MLDPATARLCVWRLPLEAAFRLFSKLGSLGGSIRERFSRTGRTRPALARPAFSRWLLENDRLRERWPCQWLNVLYFPFSETSPRRWKGVKRDAVVHFTLDALNRPNTQPRGMWIGFATCPCGLASESGVWGKAPRSCFLVFGLVS